VYHSTFNPGDYDSTDIESNLNLMQLSGYDTVRVFLDELAIGNSTGGLSSAYLDNVADFLGRAEAHGVYSIFTIDGTPGTSEYNTLLYSSCCASFNGVNLQYLTSGGVQANQTFWQAFIAGLESRNVPFDIILAYELRNELFFDESNPPLSLSAGMVITANGKSYDMSSPASKQQMMDDNLVFWIDSVRSAVLAVDPTALVSVGFFEPQQPNPVRIGDTRVINTQPAIVSSQADVIDLHPYLDTGLTLQQLVQNFEIPAVSAKPIIMGEFGAAETSFASASIAAQRFQQWEVQSCQYGFSGWLLWTWDTMTQPGEDFGVRCREEA
jgi:endo-1,4-beta-mannosidase